MKKFKYICFLLLIGFGSKADTITNWQIYMDESVLYMGSIGPTGTLNIDTKTVADSSNLIICFNTCVLFDRRRKIDIMDSTGNIVMSVVDGLAASQKISLKAKAFKRLVGKGTLRIYYDETSPGSSIFYGYPTLLCYMKLE